MAEKIAEKYKTRHLVVLIDGTWVSASKLNAWQRHSNIYELNLALETHNDQNEAQIAFYIAGLGADSTGFRRYTGGAFAADLPRDVEHAYINICSNYTPRSDDSDGDKIYLFGFSRGAVIARLVAAIISRYGILHPSKIRRFIQVWKHFIGADPNLNVESFREQYCSDAAVEFVGVFDTVLGNYAGKDEDALKRIFFTDRRLPEKVWAGIHILALDETRKLFRPVLWVSASHEEQKLEQIWMPGVHTDIGGGYEGNALAKISLLTMLIRLQELTNLKVNADYLELLKNEIRQAYWKDEIAINNELDSLTWNVLAKLFPGVRKPAVSHFGQYVHPICVSLSSRFVRMKAAKQSQLYDFRKLEIDQMALLAFFDEFGDGRNAGQVFEDADTRVK